jgi:hypothetical protein
VDLEFSMSNFLAKQSWRMYRVCSPLKFGQIMSLDNLELHDVLVEELLCYGKWRYF